MTGIIAKKTKTAFLYPGQGAVPEISPARLFAGHPEISRIYSGLAIEACPVYEDFHQQAEMNDLRAQLGVYGLSYAMGVVVARETGFTPDCVAGYSSGLYAALAAAGGCPVGRGPEMVLKAHDFMAACDLETTYVTVAIIGLDIGAIEKLLEAVKPQGWISLLNNRRQIIVSVPRRALIPFGTACEEAGALRVVELPFERPCHIGPLKPAGDKLAAYLQKEALATTALPFMAGLVPGFLRNPDEIATAIAAQIWHQVNWHRTIKALVNSGVNRMVCLDPTGVLGRIVRWITRDVAVVTIQSSADLEKFKNHLPISAHPADIKTA